ncbi:MAG: DUF4235 domain-containing protein [Actinophytocola sp.]|nr:DUF4235 domain-containing protein [Actinophytocola sp.]
MTKLLYKPLGVTAGALGGVAATAAFNRVWKLLTGQDDAPSATERNRSWREVLTAAAIQGAVFGFVKALADRGGAAGFRKLTGTWPGDDGPEPLDDERR